MPTPKEIIIRNALVGGFVWAVLSGLAFLLLWAGHTGGVALVLILLTAWVPAVLWWTWRAARTAWRGEREDSEDLGHPLRMSLIATIFALMLGFAGHALMTMPIKWGDAPPRAPASLPDPLGIRR